MAFLQIQLACILLTILTFLIQVSAQLQTSCNPVLSSSCPPNPALGKTFFWDFRDGPSSSLSTDSWWLPYIRYDSTDGVTLKVNQSGIAPTLTTGFYIMFGRLEVNLKTAAGTGIISDVIFQSDDQDEIDLEWVATQPKSVQSNFYSPRGRSPSYRQMKVLSTGSSLQTQFHNYVVDWNADRMTWSVDGSVMRNVSSIDNDQYPQTPMKITLGLWAGGDSSNAPATVYWAGGNTNYSKGPFEMSIRSMKVVDYSTGTSYAYSDRSGRYGSIKAANGQVRPHATTAASPVTISLYSHSLAHTSDQARTKTSAVNKPTIPTVYPQPKSEDGRCGEAARSSTCVDSGFGNCCSKSGHCGSTSAFCGDGCMEFYGLCGNHNHTSPDVSLLTSATSTKRASSTEQSSTPTLLPVFGISPGGYCGKSNGSTTCLGSNFGECCSKYDACGNGDAWCGAGCQPSFGNCNGYPRKSSSSAASPFTLSLSAKSTTSVATPPTDAPVSGISIGGLCGLFNGSSTCLSSGFGECCSRFGYCGSTRDFCGGGCQPSYGNCDGYPPKSPASSYQLSSKATTALDTSKSFIKTSVPGASVGSTSSLSTASAQPTIVPGVSPGGLCGTNNGSTTCIGSNFGQCCSRYGYCGDSGDYCGEGCQPAFGHCESNRPGSTLSSVSGSNSRSTDAQSIQPPNATPASSVLEGSQSPIRLSTNKPTSPFQGPAYPTGTPLFASTLSPTSSAIVLSSSISSLLSAASSREWPSDNTKPVPSPYTSPNSAFYTGSGESAIPTTSETPSTSNEKPPASETSPLGTTREVTASSYGSESGSTYSSTMSVAPTSHTPINPAPTAITNMTCPDNDEVNYLSPYSTPNKIYTLLCDRDLPPGDMGWAGGKDLFQCIKKCEAKLGCVAVTYASWVGSGACYFRNATRPLKAAKGAILALLHVAPSASSSDAAVATSTTTSLHLVRRGFW